MNSKLVAAFLAGIVAALLLGVLFMGGMMRGGGMMRRNDMMQDRSSRNLVPSPLNKEEPVAERELSMLS
ncbi:MAG: hypothetical protein AAF171_12120 [Cyanobacteria bacterium P01_A01_bin.116]